MKHPLKLILLLAALCLVQAVAADSDFHNLAVSRKNDLRLSTYMTAHSVAALLANDPDASRCAAVLRKNGVSKVCLEVYRSGLVVDKATLVRVRDCLRKHGFEIVGGIATVPGGGFGAHQKGPLGWFNWQNPKTQKDLIPVVRMAAEVFDEFIVDDFLCTGDMSEESRAAKGDRSWSEYRRDLLVRLSKDIFIDPAKEVNPDITMVIKYPQWYDRFQEFGYDLSRQPALFDRVWVGTETRGSRTLRFGFMQPYEGFVNYRWIAELSHGKIGGAWFDHGDCDAHDFVEQAYQTVLAGAPEIILFNYANLAAGHAGHDLLRRDFANLADLAAAVRKHPVTGVCSYKPANSDSGGDLYVMDFIGMLGIPLVPTARFDAGAASFFLPTQAAADEDILAKVRRAAASGATFVMTAGFLHDTTNGDALAKIAGVKQPSKKTPMRASHVIDGGKPVPVKYGLDLEADLEPAGAEVLLRAQVDGRNVPFLTRHKRDKATVYVLNTHTYSKADFEAVGEVLLAPRPLGLLEIPQSWTAAVRGAFNSPLAIHFDAPPRVTLQPLGNTAFVLCNYNLEAVAIQLKSSTDFSKAKDKFTDAPIESTEGGLKLTIPSRGTVWVVDNL